MKEYHLPEDWRMDSGGVNDIGWVELKGWDMGGGAEETERDTMDNVIIL